MFVRGGRGEKVWYQKRPEESGSPGSGVTGGCELPDVDSGPSKEQVGAFNQ